MTPSSGSPSTWANGGWRSTRARASWFNELIGRSEIAGRSYHEVRELMPAEADGESRLAAEVRGTAVPSWRSPLKAATYDGLSFDRTDGRWTARVLLDV